MFFSWCTVWFVVLTLCGSHVSEAEGFIRNMIQEVISKNLHRKPEDPEQLAYLNRLNFYSGYEVRFTAWGMFDAQKKLLLNVTGFLVSYGVLFASELRTTELGKFVGTAL
ncbi:uncharacterized protein TNIN_307591 [Trichonephila inaurata madagascariensis]|uniref:Uncharacterized protein n=1 Tax=Trichonephila inaurata madagascariensis TaxID=2747483 RepID=A0A8X6MI95_9ARAC|nr:uncharacterized protein TNIN_307591 [Trichonephila inaurata madagascariensis]